MVTMNKPMCQRQDNQYFRNLWGILLILIGGFFILNLEVISFANLFAVAGIYLLVEHIFVWGNLRLKDYYGHEYLGLAFVIIGLCLNPNLFSPVIITAGILLNLEWK